uniref:Aminotransferase-like plant mobile domain-containing protein n=1 Tax=Oryza punctata TaxID=4537 RepID=A0A0E0K2A3_ORYPU
MSAFRVYFGEDEIMENESGVDLSNFRQCTLYHPNPDTLTMPEVWYWLTCRFSLDPGIHSVNVRVTWSRSANNLRWELKNVTRSKAWQDWPAGCRRQGYEFVMLVQACEGRVPMESAAGQSSNREELGSSSHEKYEVVAPHRGGDVGPDIQNLSIQGDDVVNRHSPGEADEGEEIPAIVEEIERVDRYALEDDENLTAEGNDDEDDQEPQWVRIQVHNVYEYFTETFESLRENEVRWTPYTNEEANLRGPNGVSILCYRDEAYWMTRKMLVYDIFVEGYNVQRVMRQMRLYQQVPVPGGLHLPPEMHTQKRQADNRYHRSMHLRMTPWIEAWSQVLNDVVHETRAYDHKTYKQYMAWYSSQTRIRLLAPEDPDERGPPTIEQIYDMQLAPPSHLTTDIAGELVRDAKTLWEKLRDGIAGTNQDVMAVVDTLSRKVRSTSFREAPTIPTIPEITQMSERLGGFGSTQAQPERVPQHSSALITSQCQGGFAAFAEGTRMVRPVPQMSHARPHMIPQMTPVVPTSHWQGGFAPFAGILLAIYLLILIGPTQSVPLHAPTYGTNPWQGQSMDYGGSFRPELMSGFRPYTASYGDMSSFGGGSSSVPNELQASQTDDTPQVTQPTQPEDGDLRGNGNDPRRSSRERHEPNRLSLSGPRHAAGGRKNTTKKRAGTSRTMTDHNDE